MYRKHVTLSLLFFKFFDHIMITINATVQVPNSQCVKVTCMSCWSAIVDLNRQTVLHQQES